MAFSPDIHEQTMPVTLHPYWFMRIDQRWRLGHLWLGLLIFLLLAALLGALFGLFGEITDRSTYFSRLGICLFFACINATALVGTMAIIKRTELALDQLRPLLRVDDERFTGLRASLSGATPALLTLITMISLASGTLHCIVLFSIIPFNDFDMPFIAANLGTMLTWFVLVYAITALVRNALLFAQLGRNEIEIDALRPQLLLPVATVALLPSIALMGTQLFYPLLSLNGQFNAFATLPGFVLTLTSAIYLLLRPIWPVHVHMREAKASLLASTEAGIARWRETNPDRNFTADAVADLVPILAFRDYVRALPEWPFNLGLLGRWLFYIVIPPLTWVLAALMENFIDAMVG